MLGKNQEESPNLVWSIATERCQRKHSGGKKGNLKMGLEG